MILVIVTKGSIIFCLRKYKDETAERETIEESLSNEFDLDIFSFTKIFLLEKGYTSEILENSIKKLL